MGVDSRRRESKDMTKVAIASRVYHPLEPSRVKNEDKNPKQQCLRH
jgi:hypothetical protein